MDDGVKPPSYYHAGQKDETRTLGDFIDELCAYFMAIGMPRDEFLNGEHGAHDDYENAYQRKLVQQNQMLHLQGYYDYIAVSCALSAAFAEKGKKGTPYPSYPTPITEIERKAEKQRNIEKTLAWVRGRKKNG